MTRSDRARRCCKCATPRAGVLLAGQRKDCWPKCPNRSRRRRRALSQPGADLLAAAAWKRKRGACPQRASTACARQRQRQRQTDRRAAWRGARQGLSTVSTGAYMVGDMEPWPDGTKAPRATWLSGAGLQQGQGMQRTGWVWWLFVSGLANTDMRSGRRHTLRDMPVRVP
jgi:hypothetical protein